MSMNSSAMGSTWGSWLISGSWCGMTGEAERVLGGAGSSSLPDESSNLIHKWGINRD